MAEQLFAKIGDIKGESTDDKHKDEIQVLSWSWSLANVPGPTSGAGGGSGKAAFGSFVFTHRIDRASPQLLLACATGKHFAVATLSVRKAGSQQADYLVIRLYDALIANVSLGSSDSSMETVSLSCSRVDFEYKPQKADGSFDAGVHFKFDTKTSSPW